MLCVTNAHAKLLTFQEAEITVDKTAQTELLNKQLAEIDKLYGNAATLLKN